MDRASKNETKFLKPHQLSRKIDVAAKLYSSKKNTISNLSGVFPRVTSINFFQASTQNFKLWSSMISRNLPSASARGASAWSRARSSSAFSSSTDRCGSLSRTASAIIACFPAIEQYRRLWFIVQGPTAFCCLRRTGIWNATGNRSNVI